MTFWFMSEPILLNESVKNQSQLVLESFYKLLSYWINLECF